MVNNLIEFLIINIFKINVHVFNLKLIQILESYCIRELLRSRLRALRERGPPGAHSSDKRGLRGLFNILKVA